MKHVLLILCLLLSYPALTKIYKLQPSDINDLGIEYTSKRCKSDWGVKVRIELSTSKGEFSYSFCSSQPLSAYMSDVYPKLQRFLDGPRLGSCRIKSYCDSRGNCTTEAGQWRNLKHVLTLITNPDNTIDAESFRDIRVQSESICQPLRCG